MTDINLVFDYTSATYISTAPDPENDIDAIKLREEALFFFNLWLSSPHFRPRTTVQKIARYLKEDVFEALGYDPSTSIYYVFANLWTTYGWANKVRSTRTKGLKNNKPWSGRGEVTVVEIDTSEFLQEHIIADVPQLADPEFLLGKSQTMVADETGVPKRLVASLFHNLIATGEYAVRLAWVSPTNKQRVLCRVKK
jgi:hypothetical protein